MRALIGFSGFVGGYLSQQCLFDARYRRQTIDEMRSRSFSSVVCAGLPATKWLANQHPEDDRANLLHLMDVLGTIRTGRFILISTIDVYPFRPSCDERSIPTPEHAYGINRRVLEMFVQKRFENHHVVRLPALFGPGLKKNALFDLLHTNRADGVSARSAFQWYDLRWLPGDLQRIVDEGLSAANLFTPPIPMQTIADRFFPTATLDATHPPVHYEHRTIHAETGFLRSCDEVVGAMGDFIRATSRGCE